MKTFYSDYQDFLGDDLAEDLAIEKKMRDCREKALSKFKTVVPHPGFAYKIAMCIIVGFRESLSESQNLIKDFDLEEIEMCAIEDNFEAYKELYIKNCESESFSCYSEAI